MIAVAKQSTQFEVKPINEIEFEVVDLEQMKRNRVQHNLAEPVQCTCSRFKYLKHGEQCRHMGAIIPYLPQYEVITDPPIIPYFEFDGTPVEPQPISVIELPPWTRSIHRQPLRGQQQVAFDRVHEWWQNGAKEPFLLQGYAGTGKSFSAQKIVHSLKEWHQQERDRDLRVALCAPTHKARAVLEQFATDAGLSVDIATLHSLLHLKPGGYSKKGKQKMMVNELSSSPHYDDYDLVLVDESSMIGEELMGHIPSYIPTIFMGDRAQLPPVESDDDKEESAKEKLSPVFELASGIELTEVQRYEGAIAEYVTELRRDLLAKYPPRLVSGGNISKLNQEQWNTTLIQTYLDGIHSDSGIETMRSTRALAWSNARVAQINQLVRDAICLDAGLNPKIAYHPGELVVAKEPIVKEVLSDRYGKERKILMSTCGEAFVTGTRNVQVQLRHYTTKERFTVPCVELELRTDLGQEYLVNTVPSQNEQAWAAISDYFSEWRKACIAGKGLWREFYVALEDLNLVLKGNKLLPRLQYAYALTVHQSQGSTFKQVFVDSSNLYGCQEPWMRNRLFYTAYSRASDHLYSLSKF